MLPLRTLQTLRTHRISLRRSLLALSTATALAWGTAAQAHCDTLDGPVVSEARQALETGRVITVLKWVQPGDETEIRDAFQKTLLVRQSGPAARDLADRYFFETLVRVHRAGEGAPYSGLKPAGVPEPAINAADEAIRTGQLEGAAKVVFNPVRSGLHARFDAVMAGRDHAREDVTAGRAYTSAYVDFIHYVERLYQAAGESPSSAPSAPVHSH